MKIDYELLQKFARENGDVTMFAPKSEVKILKNGTTDVFSTIENATTFVFNGKEYTRGDLENLLRQWSERSK